jgi:ankyrin repeat domain-containing protein 50
MDPTKQNAPNFLRSILAQLAATNQPVYDSVLGLYSRCKSGREEPSLQDMQAMLLEAARAFEDLYIVIDAVDESPREIERGPLLAVIRTLAQEKTIHLLAASREELDIANSFRELGVDEIAIAGEGVASDIMDYVSGQFAEDSKLKRFPLDLKERAQEALAEKANGM